MPKRTPDIATSTPNPEWRIAVLNIGHEPIELDRPLHQPPDAAQRDQDRDCGERAEPAQDMMRAAADMPGRAAMQPEVRGGPATAAAGGS